MRIRSGKFFSDQREGGKEGQKYSNYYFIFFHFDLSFCYFTKRGIEYGINTDLTPSVGFADVDHNLKASCGIKIYDSLLYSPLSGISFLFLFLILFKK